jgi:hypothetical protein
MQTCSIQTCSIQTWPIHSPIEARLRIIERFAEVERVVLGPFKRKKWMRFRDGYLRIRFALQAGFVVVGYCHDGRQDAIVRCAREHMPLVRQLIEALSCGETRTNIV